MRNYYSIINDYPQVICIRSKIEPLMVAVCGIATLYIPNKCQDDYLILDSLLRVKGTKHGLYGFSELEPIENINQYKNIQL